MGATGHDGHGPDTPDATGRAAARLLDEQFESVERLHGGDLSLVVRLRLASGSTAVAKTGAASRAEASMLRAIRATVAPAPRVLAEADRLLVLEDLGHDEDPREADADLGRALRLLHAATGRSYGWSTDHAFGVVPIPNTPEEDWCAFWAKRRLRPFLPHLPGLVARRLEALCQRLPDLLPPRPAPALLHGDLWAGNIMARSGRVTGLIDPACYYGHSEVDTAMLQLFGAPGPRFRKTYGQEAEGAEVRRPIYQLWPALVHLRLFGAGYHGMVDRLLSHFD